MRPHIEAIQEEDLIWHAAELPNSSGSARQKNLSYDEEDGSASTSILFDTDWHRPAGRHVADTEWFVLSGEITIGTQRFGEGAYLRAPRGVAVPEMRAAANTRALVFREEGDSAFHVVENADTERLDPELVIVDSAAMDWKDAFIPGPKPGIKVKVLYKGPNGGFYTRLIWCTKGWQEPRYEHHPVFEESYKIAGALKTNWADTRTGTYFFRPAWILHGCMDAYGDDGAVSLVRSDGDLVNYYTANPSVTVNREPLNYGPDLAPIIAANPVRSRSVGAWDGSAL